MNGAEYRTIFEVWKREMLEPLAGLSLRKTGELDQNPSPELEQQAGNPALIGSGPAINQLQTRCG
jgi:hypothetical protein